MKPLSIEARRKSLTTEFEDLSINIAVLTVRMVEMQKEINRLSRLFIKAELGLEKLELEERGSGLN